MATSLTYQDGSYAPFQLKITSNEDKHQFMKAIHADFLRKVDAVETNLIDSLTSCGVLTDSDTESLDGRDVRTPRDRARKLYLILEKLPVGVFVSRVGPVLCSKFPHIIPVNFQTEVGELATVLETEKERDNYCLRCSIRRCLRVSTIADLLYGDGRLESLAYKDITANCYEDQWEKIFQAFENPKMEVTEKLTNGVREVLQSHFIAIPENLPVSLEHGLPCECSKIPLSQKNSLSAIKVKAWQQVDESAPRVSVALGNMLSDQTPLGLLTDGEEADDEDSSTHYPGSEKIFSSRDEDFENESMSCSSDVLSPNYIWDRQQHMLEGSMMKLPNQQSLLSDISSYGVARVGYTTDPVRRLREYQRRGLRDSNSTMMYTSTMVEVQDENRLQSTVSSGTGKWKRQIHPLVLCIIVEKMILMLFSALEMKSTANV